MGSNKFKFGPRLPSCPLCASTDIGSLYTIERYDPPFRMDRCASCGFIFMNPRFNESTIKDFYNENYYKGRAEYSYRDEREAIKFFAAVWDKRISVIRKHASPGNLLDAGCSFGGFLKEASPYYIPHGIEISTYAGTHARSLIGKNIHIGTLADHPFKSDYFSVITMIELLEHLPDPASALKECHRLLQSNGLLVIQTANMDGLQAKLFGRNYAYFMPGHLSYFTKKNLVMALESSGFRRIKVYYPVEFGLLPKLKKSRFDFKSAWDYRAWLRIMAYHYASKIRFRDFAITSSMVVYAFK